MMRAISLFRLCECSRYECAEVCFLWHDDLSWWIMIQLQSLTDITGCGHMDEGQAHF